MPNYNKSQTGLKRSNFLKISGGLIFGSFFLPFSSIAKDFSLLKEYNRSAFTMGSIVTFTVFHNNEQLCNKAIDQAIHEMKLIDKMMSVFDPYSQLSIVNSCSHENKTKVDSRIIEILNHAKRFSGQTGGAFDVTIEPLMELYGFRDDNSVTHFPSDKKIAGIIDGVSIQNVEINNHTSTISLTHPSTKIDLGGIAVGYAIDRCVDIFKSFNIESVLINHSGDIYAMGTPPGIEYWEVGIVDPLHPDTIITTVNIKNQALSTSGNYENYVEADGKRIGHILNPKTGKSSTSILSGTTIAPTAIEADALSTGMFVMGLERSKRLINNLNNVRFVGVVNNGNEETIVRL